MGWGEAIGRGVGAACAQLRSTVEVEPLPPRNGAKESIATRETGRRGSTSWIVAMTRAAPPCDGPTARGVSHLSYSRIARRTERGVAGVVGARRVGYLRGCERGAARKYSVF